MSSDLTFKQRLKSVSLIFACGTALFSDGYANGVIGNVNTILTRIYGKEQLGSHNYSTTISSLGFAGTVVGMLIFGYLSDKIGRKFGMMSATAIVAFFSLLSAASSGAQGSFGGMLAMLGACRFLLGIGVGAEYPCGSVSASEQSEQEGISRNAQHRWFTLATNSMIDFGFVVSAFVPLVLFWIFGDNHLRAVWRISLGLGVVPAMAVFVWRLSMEEPDRYKKDSMKHAKVPYMLILRRYGVSLAAVSFTWFLYDFIVYPFGLFSSIVVNNITGGNDSMGVVLGWAVVIKWVLSPAKYGPLSDPSSLFYMPGTLGGAFIVDYLGPKYTMITGLLAQAVIGFIMSGAYERLTNNVAAFAVVYGIFLSFGELGPGNCLGLLASKTSPTAVRGQFYGIAAAVGKVGAFVGTWAFPPMIDAFGGSDSVRGNTGPFWIGSGLAILSAIITFVFIKPLSHDGMEEEDRLFREYLEANGYDTSQMGLHSTANSDTASIEKEKISEEKVPRDSAYVV
ncbi:putative metabolite transporter [Pleurotus eryngii]|uniref:Metabolite transporter n=1 Tax=Pleurotus eryngii TaxID=5323 RepID=A0A9P6D2S1_PLEER|nr:putative metabolite transporter [Pleurotus eryngii]